MERWRNVKGFPEYRVSNKGRIKSSYKSSKILKPTRVGSGGHLRVFLYRNGVRVAMLLHRLVAEAFIPNPNLYPVVRHINDNPDDNRAENLRWGTQYDNVHDCIQRNGMNYSGMREYNNSRKTPIVATRINDGLVRVFDSQSDASKKLGITQGNIWRALRNHGTAAGYQFAYANEEVYHE